MDLLISADALRGSVTPPPSKSLQHRYLIADALAGRFGRVRPASDDVRHTAAGMDVLLHGGDTVDCGASGTTLRFLMPIAAALDRAVAFTGAARLFDRPVSDAVPFIRTARGLCISESLTGGNITLAGNVSSQFVSGLLFALPLLAGQHTLVLTGERVSAPYTEMTAAVLREYGIELKKTDIGWEIPGGQHYAAPEILPETEPDWSAAAYFLAAKALGAKISVEGLRRPSLQGDAAAEQLLQYMPEELTLHDTPDLLLPLALYAALCPGKSTRFRSLRRLRQKESDRVETVFRALSALGASVRVEGDDLLVNGRERLRGGTVDAAGDHRIAMLAGIASAFADGTVRVLGAECVGKSYVAFWDDYRALGGSAEEV